MKICKNILFIPDALDTWPLIGVCFLCHEKNVTGFCRPETGTGESYDSPHGPPFLRFAAQGWVKYTLGQEKSYEHLAGSPFLF